MDSIKAAKVERLQRALEIVRSGKKPMRAKAFAPVFGENKNCYEFNGTYFNSPEELNKALNEFQTIEGVPNIVLIYTHRRNEIS
jgi:hypothetical protein